MGMRQVIDDLKIFAGNSNAPLAREISHYLKVPLGEALVETFSDGESKVEVKENVRGGDVFVIQSKSNGLKADSVIKVEKIATLQKKIFIGELGALEPAYMKEVDKKLKMLFSL